MVVYPTVQARVIFHFITGTGCNQIIHSIGIVRTGVILFVSLWVPVAIIYSFNQYNLFMLSSIISVQSV
jgi:hypothetical protein